MCPHPGEFAQFFLKNANARGLARGGMGTAGIDWCIINKTPNRFLIYSYFITSGIFLIILILWIVKHFGQLVELALYKLC